MKKKQPNTVRLVQEINAMLTELVELERDRAPFMTISKTSVLAKIIMNEHKRKLRK